MALTKITGEGIGTTSGNLTVDVAGNIILKDGGTTVGTIGNDSTDLYIVGTTHGLKFDSIDATTMYIRPVNNSGTNVTAHIDLGQAGNVFRDAYVSGGVYFAPNAYPANYLDDYEEGTWTPSFSGLSNTPTYHILSGRYTKVGRFVMVQFSMQTNASPTFSDNNAELQITGLPFAIESVGYVSSVGAVASQALSFNGSNNSQGTTGQIVSVATTDEHITFKVISSGNSRADVRNVGATGGVIIETTLCYTAT